MSREDVRKTALKKLLKEGDAEFLLQEVKRGRYKIRVGQVWTMPKLRGRSPLLLDYDGVKRISIGNIRKRLGQCGLSALRVQYTRSPSGTGIHCLVWVKGNFSPLARIALQAILESDPAREAQNFKRALQRDYRWKEHWQVLFKKGEI